MTNSRFIRHNVDGLAKRLGETVNGSSLDYDQRYKAAELLSEVSADSQKDEEKHIEDGRDVFVNEEDIKAGIKHQYALELREKGVGTAELDRLVKVEMQKDGISNALRAMTEEGISITDTSNEMHAGDVQNAHGRGGNVQDRRYVKVLNGHEFDAKKLAYGKQKEVEMALEM